MMAELHQLPKIPGIYQSFMEIKNKYPIGSDLQVIDNVRLIKSIEKKNDVQICDPDVAMAMLGKGFNIVNKRNWMVLDKEVLSFDAYYKHTILGSSGIMNCILRKLKIIYFLVDDTIQVNELRERNSGTVHGCFIKKQKIPLPGCDKEMGPYYKLLDLVVGEMVKFYGKELRITGVDMFTRDFLNKMGLTVANNETIPEDPYFTYRKQTDLDMTLKCKSNSIRSLPPNDLDGLILRFYGYWDNRYEVEGELHFYDVLYYLIDDTMELVERLIDEKKPDGGIKRNIIVKRRRLPTNGPWSLPLGHDTKQEILKVISNDTNSCYYKMDSRLLDNKDVSFYYRTDLYIGAILNVYNRSIVLVDCDEFTKQFFQNVYGIKSFNQIAAPQTLKEIEEEKLKQNREKVILKNQDEVLRKRLIKHGGSGMIFGFVIKMIINDPISQSRHFLFKYYLDDTEFAVYEYTGENSGIIGGMFRSKRGFNTDQCQNFNFRQLAVGVNITIDDFEFTITDVDDKTIKFMIDNPEEFTHSNLMTSKSQVLESIKKRYRDLDEFQWKCFKGQELVEREEFRKIVSFDGDVDPHHVVVLAVTYKRPDPFEPFSELSFRSVVQDTLRKARFIHFDAFESNLKLRRSVSNPAEFVSREQSIKAIKSNKIPLCWDIILMLLNKYTNIEHGGIKYKDMVKFMDYTTDPVELPNGMARELLFVKPKKVLIQVNEFINALRSLAFNNDITAIP